MIDGFLLPLNYVSKKTGLTIHLPWVGLISTHIWVKHETTLIRSTVMLINFKISPSYYIYFFSNNEVNLKGFGVRSNYQINLQINGMQTFVVCIERGVKSTEAWMGMGYLVKDWRCPLKKKWNEMILIFKLSLEREWSKQAGMYFLLYIGL